ncbi:Membrane protein insertase YidC 2 [bacterium HR24]|jgi:YidC/Oxa1 family membrane protein insertase|nr:Membrane protein insertase YidC 2 [bacterium HR24]
MSGSVQETVARAQGALGRRLPAILLGLVVVAIFATVQAGRDPWHTLFVDPLINFLVLFNNVLLGQFGLAIILFTVFMRLLTLPLTVRQFQSTKAMSAIQPKVQEIQKKYKDPKRRQEELMKLYREAGVNPLGCLMPMLIQFPVWIALYRALIVLVGGVPEAVVDLSQHLYPWPYLYSAIPLEQHFLWLNLGRPDTTFVLPILVGVTTYLQQKVSTTSSVATSPEQQQMNQTLNLMMPLMFTWFTLAVPSGLGLYWLVSNIISVGISYFVYGRRGIDWRRVLLPFPEPATTARGAGKPTSAKRGEHERRRRGKR